MTTASGAADRSVIRMCMLKVAYLMEPDMSNDRFRALVEYLADQDWTNEELTHAANVLPKDQQLDQKIRYGGRLTPADWERIISGIRSIAESIKMPLTKEQMEQAIQLEPGLSRGDFKKTSQPHDDEPDPYLLSEKALNKHFNKSRQRRG